MRDINRESAMEEAILKTIILVDTITDEIFQAFEVNGSMPSSQTVERILTLQLITQRRAKDLFKEFHGHPYGGVQP